MSELRAAVIGLGVGEKHLEAYYNHPGCRPVAICDLSAERLEAVGSRHPELKRTVSAWEVLDDPGVDVVSIATYDDRHYEQTLRAIDAGKHVFVEKPLCTKEEEAADIRKALNARPGVRMSSNLILRLCPRFIRLREMIRSGDLGRIYWAESDYNFGRIHKITEEWRGRLDFYSVVYGGGVHVLDLLMWLVGDDIVEASAYGARIVTEGTQFRYNDAVVAALKFRGGAIGKMGANFGCVYPHFHTLAIYGERGTFINGREAGLLYMSRDPGAAPVRMEEAYPGAEKGDAIASFLDAILGRGEPIVTEEDAFRSMAVCFAVEKSAARGGPARVEAI